MEMGALCILYIRKYIWNLRIKCTSTLKYEYDSNRGKLAGFSHTLASKHFVFFSNSFKKSNNKSDSLKVMGNIRSIQTSKL